MRQGDLCHTAKLHRRKKLQKNFWLTGADGVSVQHRRREKNSVQAKIQRISTQQGNWPASDVRCCTAAHSPPPQTCHPFQPPSNESALQKMAFIACTRACLSRPDISATAMLGFHSRSEHVAAHSTPLCRRLAHGGGPSYIAPCVRPATLVRVVAKGLSLTPVLTVLQHVNVTAFT